MTKSERRRVVGVFREAAELLDRADRGHANGYCCYAIDRIALGENWTEGSQESRLFQAIFPETVDSTFYYDTMNPTHQNGRVLALLLAASFIEGGDHA